MASVVSPFVQNIEGGIGAFVVVTLMTYGLTGKAETAATVGGLIAALVFGGSCMVRAFRDEINILVSAYAEGARDEATEALQRENARLIAEIDRLKDEGMVAHAWGAREAAERLVRDWYVSLATGQDTDHLLSREQTMTRWGNRGRTEWEHGIRYLRNAGVLEEGRRGGIWLASSEETAFAMIARYAVTSRVSVRAANGDMAKV
jgi:hypothetical protein